VGVRALSHRQLRAPAGSAPPVLALGTGHFFPEEAPGRTAEALAPSFGAAVP